VSCWASSLSAAGSSAGEVAWGGSDPTVQVSGDVVGEDVAGPAVFEGRGGVPVPHGGVGELVEQDRDVAPWQLRNRLLRNQAWVGRSEGAHVDEVATGQPSHVGEGGAQVGGEPVDDPGAPALGVLTLQHGVAQGPVQREQFRVDGPLGAPAGGCDGALEVLEQLAVAVG